jgi:hypothetical protein
MLSQEAIDAFNGRITVNINNIKTMTPAQQDRVKAHGSRAEALLKNPDFAMFIHQYKFELNDEAAAIQNHTADDNSRRVAIANRLSGIDGFVASLQRAVYMKNRVVTLQTPAEPTVNQEEVV